MNSQTKSTLGHKEMSLFKRVVRCYEQKQFKSGLKFARQILTIQKYTEHGETLAMKGLILSCVGRRDEAYDCVKRGIKSDINSSICWHVYGLVQKSDRKYDEAMKCYLRALKMDKDNIQILRDLSLLQVQMRNYEGYLETRGQLFQLRPSQRASWLGYVVALHLLENYEEAIRILKEYMNVQQNVAAYNYEHSELLIYYAMILMEAGKLEEALSFLEESDKSIVDKVNLMEFKGELCIKMKKFEEAEKIYQSLIRRNTDNELYYEMLLQAKQIEHDECAIIDLFDTLIPSYPQALMTRWIPLKKLHGEKFKQFADSYLKKCLRKGVWALFVQLQFLYSDKDKVAVLEELYESYKINLSNKQSLEIDSDQIEQPTTEIYVNYLLAQHYSCIGNVEKALELVDNQLKHTPTLIELYTLKGKIYYDAGNPLLASKCLDEAQSLDTADRFVNCLCTKYMVEAGRFKDAEDMASKFTREGMRSIDNLNEMQCMWFLNTTARSCHALKKYGDALQKCHEVNKHFSMMIDDQFDFHSYCLRKNTLRSYVELLRTEDRLHGHQFYIDTATTAIEVYLHINEHPVGLEGDDDNLNLENLSISEVKKIKNKQRRQQKKAENEAVKKQQDQEKRDQVMKSKAQDKDETETVEEKIDGSKLVRTTAPLDEAVKFLQPLITLAPTNIISQCLAYKLYEKKHKILLMLKAIKCGLSIHGSLDNPLFHECIIKFMRLLKEKLPIMVESVRLVLQEIIKDFPFDLNTLDKCTDMNNQFLKRNNHQMLHNFYSWHVKNIICDNIKNPNYDELEELSGVVSWQDCESMLVMLNDVYMKENTDIVYCKLKEKFANFFPFCATFFNNEQINKNENTPVMVTASHFYQTENNVENEDNVKLPLVNGFVNKENDNNVKAVVVNDREE